jgi:two-component system, NarL family, response regulator NreC
MTIRIVAASEHAIYLDGLQALLESQRDMKVVGKAANGHDAVKRIRRLHPEVAIVAISLPGLNGIDVAERLRELAPATGVVVLSLGVLHEQIHRALRAGAKGFLPREAPGSELVAAVRAAAIGERYLSRKITAAIIQDYSKFSRAPTPLELLTSRERHVLQLIVEGSSSSEVSEVLSLSRKTVDSYRSRIKQKLGIGHLPGLVKFAIKAGLTSPD